MPFVGGSIQIGIINNVGAIVPAATRGHRCQIMPPQIS